MAEGGEVEEMITGEEEEEDENIIKWYIFCIIMLIICLISFNYFIVFFKTQGTVFGEGISDLGLKMKSSSSAYADREGGGSSGGLEKPRLNTQVVYRFCKFLTKEKNNKYY